MNKTAIQWTWNDALEPLSGWTWNPLVGCRRVSTGCEGCYAERLIATRLSKHPVYEGLARMTAHGPQFTGEHRLIADRLDEPLRKRNPKGGRTFVCDLGDMFFEGHTFEQIAAVWGVMAAAPHHTFQVLTKRPRRMVEFFAWAERMGTTIGANAAEVCTIEAINHCVDVDRVGQPWPLPNVWLGVSTENQAAADERIPWLLRCPAPVRFLSVEPQVGPLDLTRSLQIPQPIKDDPLATHLLREAIRAGTGDGPRAISWVIQGGESGPGARPFDLSWMRAMRNQCASAGVAFFPKQLGAMPVQSGAAARAFGSLHDVKDSHGGNESEWPEDLRGLRAFPRARAS